MTQLLAGRVALITGAGRGIGARTAQRFAECGAKVAVNYLRNQAAAESVVRAISDSGGSALAVRADVREADAVAAMVASVTERMGPPDTLVLNADAGGFRPAPVMRLETDAYESRLSDEMRAAFTPVRAVVPGMLRMGHGTILAISSALCRAPVPGFSTLAVSKAALESFVRALAVELGPHGIRVNTIEASMIQGENSAVVGDEQLEELRDLVPLRRLGRPDDVAGIATLIASDLAGFVNGAAVPVNGGQVLY
ncbi:SDR family oxidoreductase [Pseudonocardia sp. DSM 110487]|uniref:SDR family NAD(P)-dependent oxidoreductase n=1 Tax=Pseudonocardia sp. DSM 110487 TaxID=2865833 RepID=UPI001C69D5AD|nr:SDR family oxidoreductase [Pseudonocardia sp. DSM 110487]QYN32930.1 SDR family oxidoreductase [Pseudonocardia sp. DSM 110487]